MVECFLRLFEALDSMPSVAKENKIYNIKYEYYGIKTLFFLVLVVLPVCRTVLDVHQILNKYLLNECVLQLNNLLVAQQP